MKSLDIYGTLGPSLHTQDALYEMLCMGMNGVRLNLSHVDLTDCEDGCTHIKKHRSRRAYRQSCSSI